MKNKREIIEEIKKRSKKSNLSENGDYGDYRRNNTFLRALLWVLECRHPYNGKYSLDYAIERILSGEEHAINN